MSSLPPTIDTILPDLRSVWSETLGHESVCVAVLDGAADLDHPCFAGSHVKRYESISPDLGENGTAHEHGTHIASILFAQHDGPVKGIAPSCRGIVIPIYGHGDGDEPVPCSQVDLARAINLATQAGADIINISGGQHSPSGTAHPILTDAIRRSHDAGVLIVAAAGNEGCECVQIPAGLPGVVAIGAMDADGSPLPFSNWGIAYRNQGLIAPGRDIPGARPGSGVAVASGTSYAAAIVSGICALFISAYQQRHGIKPSALQLRYALLSSVQPCSSASTQDCDRVLAGRLDIGRAFATLLQQGDSAMPITEHSESTHIDASGHVESEEDTSIAEPIRIGPASGYHSEERPIRNKASGLLPADGGTGCKCGGGGPAELVYALGQLGVDFETEARRDSLAQAMSAVADNQAARPGNPHDLRQLLAYLKDNPWDAASVTWTLNIDSTPIYAIVPAGPYASATHERLREFLKDMLDGVERISVPGVISGSVRLANGQTVPAVVPELRGMYSWTTDALLKSLASAETKATEKLSAKERAEMADQVSAGVRNFLERVYFELRNLGQTSQDRAINFAATNAFNIEKVFEYANQEIFAESGKNKMDLDTIDVDPSPICRPDSDCWDVKLMFFFPNREAQSSRRVYRFTVDVSDVVPVTVGPVRTWMVR